MAHTDVFISPHPPAPVDVGSVPCRRRCPTRFRNGPDISPPQPPPLPPPQPPLPSIKQDSTETTCIRVHPTLPPAPHSVTAPHSARPFQLSLRRSGQKRGHTSDSPGALHIFLLGTGPGGGQWGACNEPPLSGLRTGIGQRAHRHDLHRSHAINDETNKTRGKGTHFGIGEAAAPPLSPVCKWSVCVWGGVTPSDMSVPSVHSQADVCRYLRVWCG